CSGIAARSLTESERRLTGLGAFYEGEHAELADRHDQMHSALHRLAGSPAEATLPDLLRLRLDGAEVGPAATRPEAVPCGGVGVATGHSPHRPKRQAAFIPVQS